MLGAKPIFAAFTLQLPFLLLFLTGVSPHCQISTAEECQKNENFVPGYSLAGEGFDITTLERKEAKMLDLNQWQRANGTCTLCQNPFLPGKPLQRLPLAATDWVAKAACQRKIHTSLQSSGIGVVQAAAADVKNDWKAGLDVPIQPGIQGQVALAGSHSRMADFTMEKSSQDKYTFASHEVTCSYYSFGINHWEKFTDHFKRALNNLPPKYQPDSQLEYHQLIGTYGTHFISHLQLGGRVRDVTALQVCKTVLDGVTADEVKDCLNIEASISISGGSIRPNAAYSVCEELKKKKSFKGNFHQTYKERHTEVVGGGIHIDLLFSKDQNTEAYKEWLEDLKFMPALLSYSLQPIHTLVPKGDPKREGLQQAVTEYIKDRALWRNCTQPCPPGTQRSIQDPCSCVCPSTSITDSMCCSRERGLARLTVTIQRAYDLKGDVFSHTDAFVKVIFKEKSFSTPIVRKNNNPVWNMQFDVGDITVLGETTQIHIEVLDEDNYVFFQHHQKLGSCKESLQSGKPQNKICYLTHGRLDFQYHLVCGPHLGGRYCLDYVPEVPNYTGDLLQRKSEANALKTQVP
ncbi:perforin-1-like [Python bivittatus]|uniref:Perforin-1-like n=1 Tax=Python bivittatus TaxID=176946 RepID=A0A9F5N2Y3_PYTBI|nr:perforin-1-like [Python bivittatus]